MSSPGRILVVEDDPDAALFAVHVLTTRGHFEVTHTADPAVALRLAASEHWDLVLTDFQLPGMSGLDLLDAIRRLAPAVPVALVTANATAAAAQAGRLRGADEYLEKPLGVNQLLDLATELIGRRRTGR